MKTRTISIEKNYLKELILSQKNTEDKETKLKTATLEYLLGDLEVIEAEINQLLRN